jgi:hypothetical protein
MNGNSMTDEQLCYAISEAREPKPDRPILVSIIEEMFSPAQSWTGNMYNMLEFWHPVDWLSWEYAGILLEEMKDASVSLYFPIDKNFWGITFRGEEKVIDVFSESVTRAIAEAYLEWKTK